MRIESDIATVRTLVSDRRRFGATIGLVPTMGALHEGHLALVRRAREDNDFVVVSIFVNPTQFGPGEDLAKYPRTFDADCAAAESAGADLIFDPTADAMYPPGDCTWVTVEGLTEPLCGRFRPGHFRGVTTVVAKLFGIVQPDRAYFGEKDYQQFVVLRRMVRDLHMPIEVLPVPTVRGPDALAMSSRNRYLSPDDRAAAPALYRALTVAAAAVRSRGLTGPEAEAIVRAELSTSPRFALQYVEAVHPDTLEPATWAGPPMLIAAAAFLGSTRLIDNLKIEA
jgi:pantoate--beta-alanine ligase